MKWPDFTETYRFTVFVEGRFSLSSSKTANGLLRYKPHAATAIIDSTCDKKTAEEVLGFGGDVPVVASLDESLKFSPNALLIGIAPIGGRLQDEWRDVVKSAIDEGLDIVSGLHTFIGDDPDFKDAAWNKGVKIWDLRKPPEKIEVAEGHWEERSAYVVLTIGTDCHVGKMTSIMHILPMMREKHPKTEFIATGQTGILLSGKGVAVDAVVSDFIAGAIEAEIDQEEVENDILLVEGQGSIYHQGYSGVTLGLIHGAMPDGFLICHEPGRETDDYGRKLPSLDELMSLHRSLMEPFKEVEFLGICLNTMEMDEKAARRVIEETRSQTGLPVDDPVRFGGDEIIKAIISAAGRKKR